MEEKGNDSAETEKNTNMPLTPPATSTTGPYHHSATHSEDFANVQVFTVWILCGSFLRDMAHMYELYCVVIFGHGQPEKTQISLHVHPVWSASLMTAWRNCRSLAILRVHMLTWVFAGYTCLKAHYLTLWLIWCAMHEKGPYAFCGQVGRDHSAQLCSLIWAFSIRQHILQYPLIL